MESIRTLATISVTCWVHAALWGMVVLGVLSGVFGGFVFARGNPLKGKSVFSGYSLLFLGWTGLMVYIGKSQGACPIHGTAQVMIFLCWSLMLFYLIAGTAYRLSFLGGLTGVAVMLFSGVAFFAGVEPASTRGDLWLDLHVGMAILSYAAFTLSAIASIALLIQDRHLKEHQLGGSYKKLPKLNLLSNAAPKLVIWGIIILTISMGLVLSRYSSIPAGKLLAACGTWMGYAVMIVVWKWRGMPSRWFAVWNIVVFVLALTVIFLSR